MPLLSNFSPRRLSKWVKIYFLHNTDNSFSEAFILNNSKLLTMPYMPEKRISSCKSDGLYCAHKIFNRMSSIEYSKVSLIAAIFFIIYAISVAIKSESNAYFHPLYFMFPIVCFNIFNGFIVKKKWMHEKSHHKTFKVKTVILDWMCTILYF